MMSLRSWLALLVFYIIYLVIGGFSFRALENPEDCKNKINSQNQLNRIRDQVQDFKGEKMEGNRHKDLIRQD